MELEERNSIRLQADHDRVDSLTIQCLHCLRSHTMCLLPHSRWRRLCSKVTLGHLAGRRDQHPPPKSADHLHSQTRSREEAFRSDHSEQLTVFPCVEILIEPPRFLWCGRPVSRLRRKILLIHPWDPQHPGYFLLRIAICRQPDHCSGKFCGMIPFKSSKKYQ